MFKFATNKLTKNKPEENESRRKLQKDLFAFNKVNKKNNNNFALIILKIIKIFSFHFKDR